MAFWCIFFLVPQRRIYLLSNSFLKLFFWSHLDIYFILKKQYHKNPTLGHTNVLKEAICTEMSHWFWKVKEILIVHSLCLMTFRIMVFHNYASISGLDAIWFVGRDDATWFVLPLPGLTLTSRKLQISFNTCLYNAVFVASRPHSHCLHNLASCITSCEPPCLEAYPLGERCCPLSCVSVFTWTCCVSWCTSVCWLKYWSAALGKP